MPHRSNKNKRCAECGGLPRVVDTDGFIRCIDNGHVIKRRPGRPNILGKSIPFEIRMPVDLYVRLTDTAERQGKSLAEIVRTSMREWLDNSNKPRKKTA